MSAYKFGKEDFERLEGVFVYATIVEHHGEIAVYRLIDVENTVYRETSIIDAAVVDGVLTLLVKEPFNGQVVITN